MDDIKIIVWIVLGLIYLFARKKKKPVDAVPTDSDYLPDSQPHKPVTFEELLAEIQGSKKPEPVKIPAPRASEPFDYEAEQIKKGKQLEDTQYNYRDHDKIYDVYENAKKEAFLRPSLEDTIKLKDTIVRFNQFKNYEKDTRPTFGQEILRDLKDPKGFKKAFIMKEILDRRF